MTTCTNIANSIADVCITLLQSIGKKQPVYPLILSWCIKHENNFSAVQYANTP